jgi:hypothetical protein
LLTATLHAAIASLAGQATGTGAISSSVISLREGVLQAMFLSKLKMTVVVFLTAGILGAGALTYPKLAGQQVDPKPAVASQRPPTKDDEEIPKLAALTKERAKAILDVNLADRMKVLLMDRFYAALTEAEARWNRYLAGKETLDIILGASLRLLEAERELSGKKADLIAALENHLRRVRELEKINQLKIEAGSVALQDLYQAKFFRAQAEIWLERAKAP